MPKDMSLGHCPSARGLLLHTGRNGMGKTTLMRVIVGINPPRSGEIIFKGEHIKHTKMVAVHTGREITVEFDRPTPLQIDGETIRDVTRYTARSSACGVNKAKEKAL